MGKTDIDAINSVSDREATLPDIAAVSRLAGIADVLNVIFELTKMRYVVVARVTESSWTACAVLDKMNFGLGVGGRLDVNTTLCKEVTDRREPIIIEHAASDADYCNHPTPKKYGIESYIAVPIILKSGIAFGTLCAIDSRPANLSGDTILTSLKLFADLISVQLDRAQSLSALTASEERYRAFISQSSEGIWRFELERPMPTDLPLDQQVEWAYEYGYLAECNDAMARQYGFDSAGALTGARLFDLLVRDDPNNTEFLRAFIRSGYRLNDAESHERDSQGCDRYFLNNFLGIVEDGSLRRAWGSQRDITDTKADELARSHLASIVESSDDAIFSFDLNKVITSWNAAAHRIYGYAANEIVGKPLSLLIPDDRVNEDDEILVRISQGEKVEHFETLRLAKDGRFLDVSLTVSPIRDESGNVVGVSKITRDIGERKATDRALHENRLMLAMAMQSGQMGVWERDFASDLVTWSDELEAIFGLKKGKFRGDEEHFYSLIHEDDREKTWGEVERAIIEKRPYAVEFRFYHGDGSIRWMEGRGEAVYSAKGDPIRMYGIGLDITERKKTDELLRKGEERFRLALSSGAVTVYEQDKDLRYVWLYPSDPYPESVIGKTDVDVDPTFRGHNLTSLKRKVLKSGESLREEVSALVIGEERWYDLLIEPRKNDDRDVVGVGGAALDITARRRVREELRQSEERLQAMFDSTTVGFAVLDTSGHFLQVNDAYCAITGYSRTEMVGLDHISLTHPDDVSAMTSNIEDLVSGRINSFSEEKRYLQKDGSAVWIQNNVSITHDADGDPLHMIAISQDVSARRDAEQEIELLSRMPRENPNPVLRLTPEGHLLYSNLAAQPLLDSWKLDSKDVPESLMASVREAFKTGTKKDIEIAYQDRILNCTIAPILEAGYVNIYGTDITTRKRALEALRESEQRFSRFMQQLPGLAWIKDLEGRYVYANEAAERSFAIKKEDLYGKTDHEVFSSESAEHFKEHDRRAIESGSGIQVLESLIEDDGVLHYSIVSKFPISGADERTALIGGMAIDVTDQKQAEEELRRRMEFDEAVMSNMGEGLYTVDDEGRVTSLNPAAEKLFGWSFQEIAGKLIHDVVHYQHRDKTPFLIADCPSLQVLQNGETLINHEDVFIRKDGTFFDVLYSSAPILANGLVTGLVVVFQDISERKRAEADLERYRHLSEYASDIIWLLKADGTIVEVNEAAVNSYGYTREELMGMNVRQLRHPSRMSSLDEQIEAARAGNTQFETVHVRKDGTPLTVEVNASSAEFGGERLIMSILRDITERKRQERDHEFLLRLADLIRTEPDPTLLMNAATGMLGEHLGLGRCFFSSVDLERRTSTVLSEYRRGKLEPLERTVSFDDYSQANLEAAMLGRTIIVCDALLDERTAQKYDISYGPEGIRSYVAVPQARDGLWSGIIFASRPERHEWTDSEVSLVQSVSERVWLAAEKLRSEAALRDSERRAIQEYRRLLERIVPLAETLGAARDLLTVYRSLQEFICVSMKCSGFFVSFYDPDKKLRVPGFIWGEGEEIDVTPLPAMQVHDSGGPNSLAILGRQTIITNDYWQDQRTRPHVVLRENGIDPMSSLVVPMLIQDRVIGTLEVQAHENEAFEREHAIALEMAANLSAVAIENVRLIETEAKARAEAETANRMKDEFLSVLSHELRTPLNAMLGWVRILRGGNVDPERTLKALEIIERNTRQQSSLIEDLLDVSRIISGKMRIERELIDLVPALHHAAESVRPLAAAKDVEFVIKPEREPLYLSGDAVRLQQVITNLLQNAIKFTAAGGIVRLDWWRDGSNVFIEVTDTGIGIDKEFLPMIFDRFSQADASTRRNNTGLGLGLTIVRTIVEMHGGATFVHSNGPGTGASFRVRIPLSEEFYREKLPETSAAAVNGDSNSLEDIKILVVDDDMDGLLPLRLLLENEKATVKCVVSAKNALEELQKNDFHILISDIGMPGMDGFELISHLRNDNGERNKDIKAIAFTAYASDDDRKRVLSSGFHVHLTKPLDLDELLTIVRDFGIGDK